ncbi:MAG: hypothetical protein ABIH99_01890 [Candidatus Micrarchaeota archaeon]
MGGAKIPPELNRAWKGTCKAILGEEIGDLQDYEGYLLKYVEPVSTRFSALSKKPVAVSSLEMHKDAKFISNEEAQEYAKKMSAPFSINSLKDLDSILEAVGERAYYAGSIVLGNSHEVYKSDNCSNSHFVLESHHIHDSKYIAYCSVGRYGEYMFGCNFIGPSKFCIRSVEMWATRAMEIVGCTYVSDSLFCAHLRNCSNCMFSFNLQNKKFAIGNLELSQEKYAKLSSKLIADLRETLKRKKDALSIVEILGGNK